MQLGEKQLLKVVKKVEFGVYLGEEDSEERVLLPIKQDVYKRQINGWGS